MYGYAGRILTVDLASGDTAVEELDPRTARKFVGSCGVAARLAYDLIPPGLDPLSPDNPIILGAGALTGTPLAAPRSTVVTKFPLNGVTTFGCAGMGLGTRLKRAGYDLLIIRGRADRPVYLSVLDDQVELHDATDLWGSSIPQATDALWRRHGKGYSVMAMGQAGERLVKLSLALVDGITAVGKGGLGAVMGSKELKAVLVGGTRRTPLAHPERFRAAVEAVPETVRADPKHLDYMDAPDLLKQYGKIPFYDSGVRKTGGVTYKNWTELLPPEEAIARYGFEAFKGIMRRSPVVCRGCSHPCKDVLEVQHGEYRGLRVPVSSTLGRIRDLGIRCGAGSLDRVLKLFDLANRYGIDCHTFAPVMDFAVELYQRGVISHRDAGGLALERDFQTTAALLEQVALRQGIGATLGDGSLAVIDRFGGEWERISTHIKGLENQSDPRERRFGIESFGQIVNPRGATMQPNHSGGFPVKEGFSQAVVRGYWERVGLPPGALDRILDVPFGYNSARLTAHAENFYGLLTALGICNHRTNLFSHGLLAELYSAATGFEMGASEMQEAADRVWNITKAINVREGFSRKDDRLPPRWLEPLKTADGREIPPMDCQGRALSAEGMAGLLDDYYQERGWDVERGIPTPAGLLALGMEDIARDLNPAPQAQM